MKLSQGSINYLNALRRTVENHDTSNGYFDAVREIDFFTKYLGSRGFDMSAYEKVIGREKP